MPIEWGSCVDKTLDPNGVATLDCIPVVLQNIINSLILLAGIVCVFLIVFAGYKFVMSEGDPEKIASARKTIFYAIGGFFLVLASFLILNVLGKFTGVNFVAPK